MKNKKISKVPEKLSNLFRFLKPMSITKNVYSRLLKFFLSVNANSEMAVNWLLIQKYFLDFEEREDDVYVASYMKSGTTWMQMLLYQMLHRGGDSFNHIYDVSPWPANEAYHGKSPEKANQLASPRILKTHNEYKDFRPDTKGKFVFIIRNGMDVAASLYHHNKNYQNPDITFNQTFTKYFENLQDNWFLFNEAWLQNKNKLNIYYVSYEQMNKDIDSVIHGLALFLKVSVNSEYINEIKKYSSFQHMKNVETKFGETPPKETRLVFNQFIRQGETGKGQNLFSQEQREKFISAYRSILDNLVSEKYNCKSDAKQKI